MPESESERSRPRAVTLAHVALAAGVSRATASQALNDNATRPVNPGTRQRVRTIASRMGYQPNRFARMLRTGGLQTTVLSLDPEATSAAGPVLRYAWKMGLDPLVLALSAHGIAVAMADFYDIETTADLGVNSAVIFGNSARRISTESAAVKVGLPFIVCGTDRPALGSSASISCDYVPAFREALELMVSSGSRRIAVLPRIGEHDYQEDYLNAYEDFCAEQMIEPLILPAVEDTEQLRNQVNTLALEGIDGIANLNGDSVTVLAGIAAAGKRTPEDVRVVAHGAGMFEDILTPPIATPGFDLSALIEALADAVAALARSEEPVSRRIQATLNRRGSL